ncbi:hypothetical protein GCM10025751_02700 [Haladaptatus pallidirubidus]|uniref:Uncharacterized protein n=1 Tax=Haladaptatus pallidirubidus TaxID=1008152 RepID=A0AAV3UBD3_9EURY
MMDRRFTPTEADSNLLQPFCANRTSGGMDRSGGSVGTIFTLCLRFGIREPLLLESQSEHKSSEGDGLRVAKWLAVGVCGSVSAFDEIVRDFFE